MKTESTLSEILAALKVIKRNAAAEALAADEKVTAIVNDSRKAAPGAIFFAISGVEADGHRYVKMAEDKGALAAVTEHFVEDARLPQFVVKNSREALALAAAAFYGNPGKGMNITGITGSNGKSTCTLMMRQVFREAGIEPGVIGSVLYSSKGMEQGAVLTTPDATDLQKFLAEMRDEGVDHVVMEVSSIGRVQQRDAGLRYQVLVFTNLTTDHLNFHGTMENYFQAKREFMLSADENACVIVNADDAYGQRLIEDFRGKRRLITYGMDAEADIWAENVNLKSTFPSFDVVIGQSCMPGLKKEDRRVRLTINTPGKHSVSNALCTFAMGLAHNIAPEKIVAGITKFYGVERRFQCVFNGDYTVFDDRFSNPGNIEVVMNAIMEIMDFDRCHIVYAPRGNRGVEVISENLLEIFKHKDLLSKAIFYNTYSTDVVGPHNEVKPEEKACLSEMMTKEGLTFSTYDTLLGAIQAALDAVQKGELIILAGSQGMDAGARVMLEELSRRHPSWDKEKLMAPVKDRYLGRPGDIK